MLNCPGVAERMASGSFEVQPGMRNEFDHPLRAIYLRNNAILRLRPIGAVRVGLLLVITRLSSVCCQHDNYSFNKPIQSIHYGRNSSILQTVLLRSAVL